MILEVIYAINFQSSQKSIDYAFDYLSNTLLQLIHIHIFKHYTSMSVDEFVSDYDSLLTLLFSALFLSARGACYLIIAHLHFLRSSSPFTLSLSNILNAHAFCSFPIFLGIPANSHLIFPCIHIYSLSNFRYECMLFPVPLLLDQVLSFSKSWAEKLIIHWFIQPPPSPQR